MNNIDSLVSDVIATAGGSLTGRVRLQKVFYLLQQLGLGTELEYDYHHYGPYSADLADAVAEATELKLIEESRNRRPDGVLYSVYSTTASPPAKVGDLDRSASRNALEKMHGCSSTVMELAATIHWLKFVENEDDWRTELKRRKGVKTEAGRTERALELLKRLGLD